SRLDPERGKSAAINRAGHGEARAEHGDSLHPEFAGAFADDISDVEARQCKLRPVEFEGDVRRVVRTGEKVAPALGKPLDGLGKECTYGGIITGVPVGHDVAHRCTVEHDVWMHVLPKLREAFAAEGQEAEHGPFRTVA